MNEPDYSQVSQKQRDLGHPAAKTASCLYLLTEDFQAGQKFDGIEVVNPFLRAPESVL